MIFKYTFQTVEHPDYETVSRITYVSADQCPNHDEIMALLDTMQHESRKAQFCLHVCNQIEEDGKQLPRVWSRPFSAAYVRVNGNSYSVSVLKLNAIRIETRGNRDSLPGGSRPTYEDDQQWQEDGEKEPFEDLE